MGAWNTYALPRLALSSDCSTYTRMWLRLSCTSRKRTCGMLRVARIRPSSTCVVARDHPVLRGRGQLVGDQLPGVVQLLAQVLDAHEGEEADQQQGQQQGRAKAYDLRAGAGCPSSGLCSWGGLSFGQGLGGGGRIDRLQAQGARHLLVATDAETAGRIQAARPAPRRLVEQLVSTASQSSWSL